MLQAGPQDLIDTEATARRRCGPALGNDTGIGYSTVSRIYSEIDEAAHEYQHLFLDATYFDVRHGRVVSSALVVAAGVSGEGQRSCPRTRLV